MNNHKPFQILLSDNFPFKAGDIVEYEVKEKIVVVESPSIIHHYTIEEFESFNL